MVRSAKEQGAEKTTASRAVTSVLVQRILQGHYASGTHLATEREMAEEFGVSRHVVREALKRLEAMGLVRILQGSGVYTNDVMLTGGVELAEFLLFDGLGRFERHVLDDFFTFWRLFIPDVLRQAALNRSDEEVEELQRTVAERRAFMADLSQLMPIHQRLLRLVSQATHNVVYQLIFNNVGRVLTRLRAAVPLDKFSPIVRQEDLEQLCDAINRHDGDMAVLIARRQIEAARQAAEAFLRLLEEAPEGAALRNSL